MELTGVELIAIERARQIEIEGFSAEYDDKWVYRELEKAAVAYASGLDGLWPWGSWDPSWYKPKDKLSNLIRAGALIAAEIDRINRGKAKAKSKDEAYG